MEDISDMFNITGTEYRSGMGVAADTLWAIALGKKKPITGLSIKYSNVMNDLSFLFFFEGLCEGL